jgi:phage terminase large subunit-like protein
LIARDDVNVITGTSFENRANLAPAFFDSILARYAGSRLAEQEIYARVLESTDGAIVNHDMIDKHRVTTDRVPEMVRVLVAVDPAVSSGQDSDSTGIVVCGLGVDDHVYILDDRTCKMSPEGWTRRVVEAMGKWKADRCIGEINNGGALIEACLRAVDKNISYQSVTASRGKHVRFEPVGSLFEQGRIHMVGQFPSLEDQVVLFTPEGYAGEASPDACDALVWGVTSLVLDKKPLANVWSL